jgi:DNA polymerase I-like protein with 3'-5' exonuclease and polymerase domains
MTVIRTEELTPDALRTLSEQDAHQIYCGLDCAVTLEVLEELLALSNSESAVTLYGFERAMQAPALDMMLRGFKIDGFERARGIQSTEADLAILREQLDTLAQAVWGTGLNASSPKQLKEFFYGAMRLPEVWQSVKGERKLSLNREALEKLDLYFHARPFISLIISARDLAKRLSVLTTEVSHDGRMRTSYNIGGTNTGRWSSSSDVTGVGTNLQNITPQLRRMFVADRGWKLCGIDLEQAESREVGWLCGTLFGDWSYLNACENGDLHTATAQLIWPSRKWSTNSDERQRGIENRKLAEEKFYRDFSYRDMAKRGGHGSNYMGSAWTMSRHLKVPLALMEAFQSAYFSAFPCIPRWHQYVAAQIQTTGTLTTSFGRTRQFFGRPDDDATLRKAIAFVPQSSTGDRLNLGVWRVWDKMRDRVELLAQVHDALYFQYREDDDENEIVAQALELVRIEMTHGGRTFVVPGEAKVGWNWGATHNSDRVLVNPDGLGKWVQGKRDIRKRSAQGRDRVLG